MDDVLKSIKNKKGFVAIEAVIILSGVMFFILLFISILTYNYPRIMLEKEVQILAQTAKIQGGLTDITSQNVNSDIEVFKDRMEQMGYNRDEVVIAAKTIQGNLNAIGVTPINDSTGDNYIKRDSKEFIEITVTIPSSENVLKSPLKYFGMKNALSGKYVIREVVGSERW